MIHILEIWLTLITPVNTFYALFSVTPISPFPKNLHNIEECSYAVMFQNHINGKSVSVEIKTEFCCNGSHPQTSIENNSGKKQPTHTDQHTSWESGMRKALNPQHL